MESCVLSQIPSQQTNPEWKLFALPNLSTSLLSVNCPLSHQTTSMSLGRWRLVRLTQCPSTWWRISTTKICWTNLRWRVKDSLITPELSSRRSWQTKTWRLPPLPVRLVWPVLWVRWGWWLQPEPPLVTIFNVSMLSCISLWTRRSPSGRVQFVTNLLSWRIYLWMDSSLSSYLPVVFLWMNTRYRAPLSSTSNTRYWRSVQSLLWYLHPKHPRHSYLDARNRTEMILINLRAFLAPSSAGEPFTPVSLCVLRSRYDFSGQIYYCSWKEWRTPILIPRLWGRSSAL